MLTAWQRDYGRAVCELDDGAGFSCDASAEKLIGVYEGEDFVEHYHALTHRRADNERGCFRVCEGVMDCFRGNGRGFSSLPSHASDYSFSWVVEKFLLERKRFEVED